MNALRRLAALVAAVVLFAPAAPHAAATSRAVGFVLTRTHRDLAPFDAELTVHSRAAEASLLVFGLTGTGSRRHIDRSTGGLSYTWGKDSWPRVYAPGVPFPRCPEPSPLCADPVALPMTIEHLGFSGHPSAGAAVYVAAWDADLTVDLTGTGWRMRPWQPSMQVVTTDEGGGIGLRVSHGSWGTFARADADGGRYGSIAVASMPCSRQDEGSAAFTGGRTRYDLTCQGDDGARSDAAGRTRWSLAGDVTSTGSDDVVMVVVDFPKS